MKHLNLLTRLARQSLDERGSELGHVVRARADAAAELAAHEEDVASESRAVADDLDALAAFGAWSRHAGRRGGMLLARAAELDRIEATARDALRDAFAETRRLELVQEAADRERRRAAQRRADHHSDEQERLRRAAGRG